MKRKSNIIGFVIFALMIIGFVSIKNMTETKNGTINMYTAVNLQLDKILNPKSNFF